MTTLSVVVPMRDIEKFAGTMFASLELNARDFEPGELQVVVVDDASTDRTPEFVADFARRLPGVVVALRNETPEGPSEARNRGLAATTGRYIAYLDGDDWIGRGYLAGLVAAIDDLGVDFVRVDHVQCRGRNRVQHRAPEYRRGVVLDPRDAILPPDDVTMVDYPFVWAGVCDRRLLDAGLLGFPDGLHTAEDRVWTWRLHLKAATFAVAPLEGYFYRRDVSSSLTMIGDARQLHFIDAHEIVLDEVRADPDAERLMPKAVRTYCAMIVHHVRLADRFTPALRQELRRRSSEALAAMPQDVLRATVLGMGADRAAILHGLHRQAPKVKR
jgi:glycosyltransferase involved in cell wall biosynthesis